MKFLPCVWVAALFVTLAAFGAGNTDSPPSLKPALAAPCGKSLLLDFQTTRRDGDPGPEIPVWQVPSGSAFFFEANMAIDADGAPNAYSPDDMGLDALDNAGDGQDWWALALDENHEPYIQGPDDPFPGFYISTTALWDRTKDRTDPSRYVDASKIPYVVLPGSVAREAGARLGDFALVFNRQNGKISPAIFADIGPSLGEGSIALAENLGVRSDARRGGARDGIVYIVFPSSGNGQPRPLEEIVQETEKLAADPGAEPVKACVAN